MGRFFHILRKSKFPKKEEREGGLAQYPYFRIHRYPKNIIEVTLTFGATDEMILAAETAINDYYSGELGAQGDETEKMGEVMENYFGGYWSVGIFDDPYGYSWTVIRRSPSFVMFDVNGKGVAFAKEGGIGKR
ncbi:hypothetical protein Aduo_013828 [Ancylostoma duodenale]